KERVMPNYALKTLFVNNISLYRQKWHDSMIFNMLFAICRKSLETNYFFEGNHEQSVFTSSALSEDSRRR
ncbi:MAG: hypothetical protein P8I46_10650, partial [Pseudomonadales bacterium]|nr:hypothetical protein [Pseudomonadales bacterium]